MNTSIIQFKNTFLTFTTNFFSRDKRNYNNLVLSSFLRDAPWPDLSGNRPVHQLLSSDYAYT